MAIENFNPSKSQVAATNLQAVEEGIVQAALAQPAEAIEQALRSFEWISKRETYEASTSSLQGDQRVPQSGFVAPPADYLAASGNQQVAGEIVAKDQLIAELRSQGTQFQQGLDSFLKVGIQESLASLKPNMAAKSVARTAVPEPLNDLLQPDQVKSLSPSRLKPSVDAVNGLYSTVKTVQAASTQLDMNRLRMIRA